MKLFTAKDFLLPGVPESDGSIYQAQNLADRCNAKLLENSITLYAVNTPEKAKAWAVEGSLLLQQHPVKFKGLLVNIEEVI